MEMSHMLLQGDSRILPAGMAVTMQGRLRLSFSVIQAALVNVRVHGLLTRVCVQALARLQVSGCSLWCCPHRLAPGFEFMLM